MVKQRRFSGELKNDGKGNGVGNGNTEELNMETTYKSSNRSASFLANQETVKNESEATKRGQGIYQRICRGMVFRYDIDPTQDKDAVHSITVNGYSYHDYQIFGKRPWVVVSCDKHNQSNTLVSIAPMSTGKYGSYNKSHVCLHFMGHDTCIMTEQIRSVNAIELQEYMATLTDDTMQKVSLALMNHLGIGIESVFSESEELLKTIETLVENKVKEKLEEASTEKANMLVNNVISMLNSEIDQKDKHTENENVLPISKVGARKVGAVRTC